MQPHPTILVIGEILFDVFPTYRRLGGASFNFAYHLTKLGFPVHFVSRLGTDEYGREILSELNRRDFDTTYIQMDPLHPTGTVQVTLDDQGVPEFDIVTGVAYDYIAFDPDLHAEMTRAAELIYFGTLVQRSRPGFQALQQFLAQRSAEAICFHDINLRSDFYSETIVLNALNAADVLKLNVDELQVCRQICRFDGDDPAFISHLRHAHEIDTLALTAGEQGSTLYTHHHRTTATPPPLEAVADTVGAGDGFAAMLAAGLLSGWPAERILSQATDFAARICTLQGAIPDSDDFYTACRRQFQQGA